MSDVEGRVERLRIDGLAAGGRGVARIDGRVWFVGGGLPGDEVRAIAERDRGRFVEGRLLSVEQPSADRRDPPCPIQERCGGCPWMPLPEADQRRWKRRLLIDALERVGGVEAPPVAEVDDGGAAPLGYRNRIELVLARDATGRTVLGYRGRDNEPLDVDSCPIAGGPINAALQVVRGVLLDPQAEPARTVSAGAGPFRVLLRRAGERGAIVGLFDADDVPFPAAQAVATRLIDGSAGVIGVARIGVPGGRRGRTRRAALAGRIEAEERLGEWTVRVPLGTFTQVHDAVGDRIAAAVARALGQARRVWDLYGGVGRYGVEAAARGARAVVCDADRDAVEAGRRAAQEAGRSGIRFVHRRVLPFLRDEARRRGVPPPDAIVANPPRSGLDRGVTASLARSGVRRIVLVSCDPATLARDARSLLREGFALERVAPFDLFPQTAHVEAVAVFTAREPRRRRPAPSRRAAPGSR